MKKITPRQYVRALLRISKEPNLDEALERFFGLIGGKGHLSKLAFVLEEYKNLAREKKEGVGARLFTALSENQNKISEAVKKIKIPGIEKMRITAEVDKNLLGGFVLRVKDVLIDASIKKQINNLKKSLI